MNLKKAVLSKINDLGPKEASKFFGVSLGTVSNWANGKSQPSIDAAQMVLVDAPPENLVIDPITTWDGKDVIMLQPVYRTINPDTHFTLFANYARYGPDKVGLIQEKRTCIWEGRNILAEKFLKTTAKWGIMTDDDMIFPCGNVALFNDRYGAGVSTESASFNFISRLMSHPEDKRIIGGLYFGRTEKGKAQCHMGFSSNSSNEDLRRGRHKGLVPDKWVGTGGIRIHRNVFEQMKLEIDNGRWPECKPSVEGERYGYFNPIRVGVGEDVSFGRRAEEIGIQTYLDASLVMLHVGDTPYGPRNTSN